MKGLSTRTGGFCWAARPAREQPAYDDSAWRRLDVPHDWSIEDLPPATPESYRECPLPVVAAAWRFRKGDDAGWKAPDLDDSSWQSVRMPDTWEHHSDYTEDNVYGWYRRRVEIPAEYKGRDVTFLLGRIDDVDEAFVNGVWIGGNGTFPPQYKTAYFEDRRYVVPASLLKCDGTDLLAVRVFDGTGFGGLVRRPDTPLERVRVGPFDTHLSEGGMEAGYFVGGVGWYRKRFKLSARDRGKSVRVRFDGVYMDGDVWINGRHLGNHPYGYTSFDYDLTPHLNPPGQENVLAVRVRNIGKNTRWYSGSGIYRHVWLTVTDPASRGYLRRIRHDSRGLGQASLRAHRRRRCKTTGPVPPPCRSAPRSWGLRARCPPSATATRDFSPAANRSVVEQMWS